MRLSLVTEHRFHRSPDGAVWAPAAAGYAFWSRYLSVFEEVNVTARIMEVPSGGGDFHVRADGPGVEFSGVPHYLGPYQYVLRWRAIRNALARAIRTDDAVIFRVPSFLVNCIEPVLYGRGQAYGLEVVGDPYDGLAPGAIRHLLRPLLRIAIPRQMRRQCAHAAGVAYVTKAALQRRYPGRGMMVGVSDAVIPAVDDARADGVFTTHYSSLSLARESLSAPRAALPPGGPLRLICVASLEQYYKGHDILLRAFALCVDRGADLRLALAGDGRIRDELEALAVKLGIRSRCEFLGHLSPAGVLRELDDSNLFVLPSRTEGLPRALIEAMARGLPCIATDVGGIPELLPPEDMVRPGDAAGLASKLADVAGSTERRGQMSRRNVAVAHEYTEDVLQARRVEFFRFIRAAAGAGPVSAQEGSQW